MAKLKTIYICQNCSYVVSQWMGQCPNCHEWNTFVEDVEQVASTKPGGSFSAKMRDVGFTGKPKLNLSKDNVNSRVHNLSKVVSKAPERLSSNISEFDRVLGGGFVPGQVILLGGEPGVGKSTILTELARNLDDKKVLYVCGEESIEQIKLRTDRMDYAAENMFMLPDTDIDVITSSIQTYPDISLVIVDSIQTLVSNDLAGVAGTVTQVRGCVQLLTSAAKSTGIPIVIVGHVTKEGVVAGPKVLEHIVDTVLYLEGDSQHMYRILRTEKNRFGPVSEVGIFEMTEKSMKAVDNPSELFLSENGANASGSCVTVVMEGQRPLLFEIQALTVRTTFGYPKRTASGYNVNRLQVLLAILEKRCGLNLSSYDVYLNVAGGFKVSEYSSDLAVCIAVASAIKDTPVKDKTVVFGECGLSGEIRRVSHQERRSREAKKLGFTKVISGETHRSLREAVNSLLPSSKSSKTQE